MSFWIWIKIKIIKTSKVVLRFFLYFLRDLKFKKNFFFFCLFELKSPFHQFYWIFVSFTLKIIVKSYFTVKLYIFLLNLTHICFVFYFSHHYDYPTIEYISFTQLLIFKAAISKVKQLRNIYLFFFKYLFYFFKSSINLYSITSTQSERIKRGRIGLLVTVHRLLSDQ